jgi:hypothetical protein
LWGEKGCNSQQTSVKIPVHYPFIKTGEIPNRYDRFGPFLTFYPNQEN